MKYWQQYNKIIHIRCRSVEEEDEVNALLHWRSTLSLEYWATDEEKPWKRPDDCDRDSV